MLPFGKLFMLVTFSLFAEKVLATSIGAPKINGYASVEYERRLEKKGAASSNGGFDADSFDVLINWNASDRLRISADFTWDNEEEKIDLDMGFGEYSIYDWLKVRFGKFRVAMGGYNEIDRFKTATVSIRSPKSTTEAEDLSDDAFPLFPQRGAGIGITGDFRIGEIENNYILQVVNGQQESAAPTEEDEGGNGYDGDNNISKGVVARLNITPHEFLTLGPSFYFESDADDDPQSQITYQTIGLQGEVSWAGLLAKFELMNGVKTETDVLVTDEEEDGGTSNDNRADDSQTELGWNIELSYHLPIDLKISPYIRYESLDPNTDEDKDAVTVQTWGINWQIEENFVFKLENEVVIGESNLSGDSEGANGRRDQELALALAVGF